MLKFIFVLFLSIQSVVFASSKGNFFFQQGSEEQIFVNNRILAKVNGKAISVIDLVKKMDMVFYRAFPQYRSVVRARLDFYRMNWEDVLKDFIEKELVLADAEENKIEVSHGDIRQEMEDIFGPNIIGNLDKAGLTYEEAWKMVKEEQILRRVIMIRVNRVAFHSVTPQRVRKAYEEYALKNKIPDTWRYAILSIRGKDKTLCQEVANHAYQLLKKEKLSKEKLKMRLDTHPLIGDGVTYTLSDEFLRSDKDLSTAHREILQNLQMQRYSKPVEQKSRSKDTVLLRIFHLIAFNPGGLPPFSQVEKKLETKLIEERAAEERKQYLSKLRKRFHVEGGLKNPLYAKDFEPFVMQ